MTAVLLCPAGADEAVWLEARHAGIGASEIACSVTGCPRRRSSRGMCHTHYTSALRRGEITKLPPPDPRQQVERRVRRLANGCWEWSGSIDHNGYGYLRSTRDRFQAHRLSYQAFVGPIPDGLDLDHACHTRDRRCAGGPSCPHRRCVNPAHLEPMTGWENRARGQHPAAGAMRTDVCINGHELSAANVRIRRNGTRACRPCARARTSAWRRSKR